MSVSHSERPFGLHSDGLRLLAFVRDIRALHQEAAARGDGDACCALMPASHAVAALAKRQGHWDEGDRQQLVQCESAVAQLRENARVLHQLGPQTAR